MAEHSTIEWTDATWNPITGCSVVSPGCANCYAMGLAGTRLKHHWSRAGLTRETKAGPVWTGEVRFNEGWLDQPLGWRRPRRIFVCAHGDLFHEAVPDDWIDRVFAVMALAPRHQFQVLTKRAARMRAWFGADPVRGVMGSIAAIEGRQHIEDRDCPDWPLPNVWLGVSVEDQRRADERVPDLLATPAAIRFISAEPLLGAVRLDRLRREPDAHDRDLAEMGGVAFYRDALQGVGGIEYSSAGRDYHAEAAADGRRLDWVICGGESGTGARPMHPDWARALRDQCTAAGVPFFFKQWGEWQHGSDYQNTAEDRIVYRDGDSGPVAREYCLSRDREGKHQGYAPELMARVGKARAGRLLDGVAHDAMPGPLPPSPGEGTLSRAAGEG